jgi:hypothetical protein
MEKTSTYGEILYTGFNFCKDGFPRGFSKLGYKRCLRTHLLFLRRFINRIEIGKIEEDDTVLLKEFFEFCKSNNRMGRLYLSSSAVESVLISSDYKILTAVDSERINADVNRLMLALTEAALAELKNIRANERKMFIYLHPLHNLARYYLNKDAINLFDCQDWQISAELAMKYAFGDLDDETRAMVGYGQ